MDKLKSSTNYRIAFIAISIIIAIALGSTAKADTIATFDDPTSGVAGTPTPMFTIDLASPTPTVSGGWLDTQTNLDLEVMGVTYPDAFFTMSTVNIIASSPSWFGYQRKFLRFYYAFYS